MITPAAISRRLKQDAVAIDEVAQSASEVIRAFCDQSGFPFVGRRKAVNSVAEKLESGRFAAWSDLEDLYACTVVIPTLRHETAVLEYLKGTFEEKATRLRGTTKKSPEVFRFDSTRFIATLRAPPGLEVYELKHTIAFEVQIRTAFEHAWQAATHDLVYKAAEISWSRLRLAAQLKAAVEQLDTLVMAFESTTSLIQEQAWDDIENRVQVANTFKGLLQSGDLPAELEPKDWSRFAENFLALLRAQTMGPRINRDQVASALERVSGAIRDQVDAPMSLSLMQWVLGLLVTDGRNIDAQSRYHALVTDELRELFPATRDISNVCNLDA